MSTLAEKLRPHAVHPDYLVGPAAKIWQRDLKMWREQHKFHVIFWGPPGSGKTTLGTMLAEISGLHVTFLSAVRDGVKEIKAAAENNPGQILFIDEIHRLSKSQQDVLLPILEHTEVWMIGATTESPRVSLNPAILSRIRTIYVAPPKEPHVAEALERGLDTLVGENENTPAEKVTHLKTLISERLARMAAGDVRLGLNLLESLFHCVSIEDEEEVLKNTPRAFTSKQHYDWISAMIKSLRGSDPDAALFYAITALDKGEDPVFIMRRCVIFASEDVGNADPTALTLAVSALRAVEAVGLPEGRIPLAQAVTYLASTVKSNKAYIAIDKVREWREAVEEKDPHGIAPPLELTRAGAEKYKYPHSYKDAFVRFEYLPKLVSEERNKGGPAYFPSEYGVEGRLGTRLKELWSSKEKKPDVT